MQFRIALALFISTLGLYAAPAEVRVWETNLVIPTYLAAPPSAVPRFYEGRTYPGAKSEFLSAVLPRWNVWNYCLQKQ